MLPLYYRLSRSLARRGTANTKQPVIPIINAIASVRAMRVSHTPAPSKTDARKEYAMLDVHLLQRKGPVEFV